MTDAQSAAILHPRIISFSGQC